MKNIRNVLIPSVVVGAAVVLGACSADRATSAQSPTSSPAPSANSVAKAITPTVPTPASETNVNTARSISVHGVGKKSQAPDQVTITMGVETQAATAADALRANNAKATELIALLKARGVEDKHLQTSQLSIYPQYDNQGRRITGYNVSNVVTATMTDIKGAGTLIDAAASVAGDAIRVQGLSFSLSDSAEALKTARERAVADGRLQAEQFAAAAGVKVGTLRLISTSAIHVPVPVFQQNAVLAKAADAGSVPIEGGAQEVTAEVDLVFDIAE